MSVGACFPDRIWNAFTQQVSKRLLSDEVNVVCLSLNAVFDIDRKTQIWVSGKQVCGKEILMCVIMVKLHIVNMTVTVDYIPAVMLFPDLQEG